MTLLTYCYLIESRWFGLRHRCFYCDSETHDSVWEGPWRWSHRRALADMTNHSYEILLGQMAGGDDGLDLFREAEAWDEDEDEDEDEDW